MYKAIVLSSKAIDRSCFDYLPNSLPVANYDGRQHLTSQEVIHGELLVRSYI